MMEQRLARPVGWRISWKAGSDLSRTDSIGILMSLLLLGLAGLQWSAHSSTRQGFFDRFEGRGAVAASFISSYLEDVMERERRFGRRFLADPTRPLDVQRMTAAFGMAAAVVVEDGRYLVGSPHDPAAVGKDMTSYDHIRSAAQGRETISNMITSVVRREPLVAFAAPLDLPDRNLVVSGGLSVEDSQFGAAYLSNITPIERAEVFLVDGNNQIIASNRPGRWGPFADEAPSLAEATQEGSSGTFGLGGEEGYFTSHSIDGTSWTLVMSAATDDILDPVRETWEWLLLAALAGGAAVTVGLVHRVYKGRTELQSLNDNLEARVEERTAELAASNSELESFAYSVSHDLRAPLRAMDGFSKIVLDEYAAELPSEAQRFLGVIRDNATKMQSLIDDLLRYSRLGRHKVELHPVDLNEVVASVVGDLTPVIQEHQTHVTTSDLPEVLGDHSLMWQVLLNLIDNAVKFSRDVPDPRVEIGGETRPDHTTLFWVRDNGAGFDMTYAHKLFGVFQRLHRVEDYEGSGVGLATVHRIVTRHGGRIWAQSAPGRGATFYVVMKGTEWRTG